MAEHNQIYTVAAICLEDLINMDKFRDHWKEQRDFGRTRQFDKVVLYNDEMGQTVKGSVYKIRGEEYLRIDSAYTDIEAKPKWYIEQERQKRFDEEIGYVVAPSID